MAGVLAGGKSGKLPRGTGRKLSSFMWPISCVATIGLDFGGVPLLGSTCPSGQGKSPELLVASSDSRAAAFS